jgi:Protein of unknown function (DUF664)
LERVLFHLLQEYARHVGQLDVVVELVTGTTVSSARSGRDQIPARPASRRSGCCHVDGGIDGG